MMGAAWVFSQDPSVRSHNKHVHKGFNRIGRDIHSDKERGRWKPAM